MNQLFESPKFGLVRTAGTPEQPEFCLSDVCSALALDTANVRRRLSDGVCTVHPTVDALGRTQPNVYINEDGLYDVILDSRKPEAKAFRKWITSEVIPSIRKTGGYIQASADEKPEDILAKAILIAQKKIEELQQRGQVLEGKNALLEEENKELAPKAEYTDKVLQAPGTYTISEMAKELNFTGWKTFVAALKKKGIMFKHPGGRYMLYSDYSGKNYTTSRTNTFTRRDGTIDKNTITVWTEEGRRFLHEKFNVAFQPVDLTMFSIPDRA